PAPGPMTDRSPEPAIARPPRLASAPGPDRPGDSEGASDRGIAAMSTITPPRRARAGPRRLPRIPAELGEQRIAIRDVTWDLYDRLSDAIDEHQHVYVAYDGKDMEIMTTGWGHEDYKELLGRLVNAITDDLHIPCRGAGQTTWKRPEIERGIEA